MKFELRDGISLKFYCEKNFKETLYQRQSVRAFNGMWLCIYIYIVIFKIIRECKNYIRQNCKRIV